MPEPNSFPDSADREVIQVAVRIGALAETHHLADHEASMLILALFKKGQDTSRISAAVSALEAGDRAGVDAILRDHTKGGDALDWSLYSSPTAGVRISDEGYYTCESCDETIEPTGEVRIADGRRRAMWECPGCHERYPI